jgi:hypothetical protein
LVVSAVTPGKLPEVVAGTRTVGWQVSPMHPPPKHPCPHIPQLLGSVFISTHALPHVSGVPPEQLSAHFVPLHDAAPVPAVGPWHAPPHTPPAPHPFCGPGASHVPLQSTVPAGHPHIAPEQTLPPVHALPQLPQLALSLE